jgi:hypothetical protein
MRRYKDFGNVIGTTRGYTKFPFYLWEFGSTARDINWKGKTGLKRKI